MKSLCALLCLGALLVPAVVDAGEQLSMYGYIYFTPPEDVGTVTTLVGRLEPPIGFTYPFTVDFNAFEYTFYLQTTIEAIVPGPFGTDYTYADAELFIYEDPAKDSDYGTAPPNATAPTTFRNGTLALHATLTGIVRSDDAFGMFDPTLMSDCTFDTGSKVGALKQKSAWTLSGGLVPGDPSIPSGYGPAWVTQIVFTGPVSVESSTWGGIKALFDGK